MAAQGLVLIGGAGDDTLSGDDDGDPAGDRLVGGEGFDTYTVGLAQNIIANGGRGELNINGLFGLDIIRVTSNRVIRDALAAQNIDVIAKDYKGQVEIGENYLGLSTLPQLTFFRESGAGPSTAYYGD